MSPALAASAAGAGLFPGQNTSSTDRQERAVSSSAVAVRPAWLQDPTLAWRPAVRGVVLCAHPHDLAGCLGPNAVLAAVAIGPPRTGYDHLCGVQELLAVLLPAARATL